jgi:demethylmenaquinone methyltransferase/2-methoxy-6-polyprenyl-1,4-benzoquinol methylase
MIGGAGNRKKRVHIKGWYLDIKKGGGCMLKSLNIKRLFERIAFSYDLQNSVLSLRRDVSWRKNLAHAIQSHCDALILDAATGTAEVAMEICRGRPHARVVGVDFSPQMLKIGLKKTKARKLESRIGFSLGDCRHLPLKNDSFDAVTIAFGIRNIEDRHLVLAEFRRVLKPGGQLFVMEFDYPDDPLLSILYRFYFDHILPPLGNWLSRTSYAYTYLVESVKAFPDSKAFLGELASAGFDRLKTWKLTYGIAKIYCGTKGSGSDVQTHSERAWSQHES